MVRRLMGYWRAAGAGLMDPDMMLIVDEAAGRIARNVRPNV